MKQVIIRINMKDFNALKKIFPMIKGESHPSYFRRYILTLQEQEREQ